jgi:hypothetical protein
LIKRRHGTPFLIAVTALMKYLIRRQKKCG